MAGVRLSKAYLAKEKEEYAKGGSENTPHERKEKKKKEIAEQVALANMNKKRGKR